MISIDTIPALLLPGLAALLVVGLVVVVVGERLPRRGDWLVGIPLAYLLIVFGMAWNALSENHFSPRAWNRGWIWPRGEAGAITVGMVLDPLGILMAALATIVVALFLIDLRERSPKNFGAMALSASGVILAWTSLTPWLSFCGTGLAVFGGFLSMGSRWQQERGSIVAGRFAWERCWGLLLSVIGLCILAGPRGSLEFTGSDWSTQAVAQDPIADWVGMSVMLVGLLVQFQPFPFFGELVLESGQPAPIRILLRQVFPGWCAFASLLRIAPHLESAGPAFTVDWQILGWTGFASAVLAVASGLVQPNWKSGLSLWVSAAFGIAIGALSFAGVTPAMALLVGASLGALILAKAGDAFEEDAPLSEARPRKPHKKGESGAAASDATRGRWFKVAAVFGAASATGMIGFLSASGALGTLTMNAGQPFVLAIAAFVFLLNAVLCWSFVWKIGSGNARASWISVATTFAIALLTLGFLWTGTASGGAIPDNPDTLFGSLFAILFSGATSGNSHPTESPLPEGAFVTASGLHWGALGLGLLIAFWFFGRRADRQTLSQRSPRFAAFLASGYGVDAGFASLRSSLVRSAQALEWILNDLLWKKWLPALFSKPIRGTSRAVTTADSWISEGLGIALRRSVEAPAKALQYIQNGDVRWYLLFAVGSGFFILLHFAAGF